MPIVNYVREHRRFIEYASDEKLTASEMLLWYALMHIMNGRAQGNVWPEEFIRIDNDRVLALCPIGYDAMARARNGLKQRGRIDYIPGEKRKLNPAYRMIYFYPEYVAPDTEHDAEGFNPFKTDNDGGNQGGNEGYKAGGNGQGNDGDMNINSIPRLIPLHQQGIREEDEKGNDLTASQARERVRQAWEKGFGKAPEPVKVELIIARGLHICHFEMEVIEEAIRMTALRSADDPMGYILECFRDWGQRHIRSMDELEDYLESREDWKMRGWT